ncbi:hypothetical protein QUW13_11015 [Enterococcus hirae]|nr:hypothetical protein [Enterococcus hirae]
MLLENLLIKTKSKQKIKCSQDQLNLLKNKVTLQKKAEVAQKIYNRSFMYILLSLFIICALYIVNKISKYNVFNEVSMALITIVAVPMILSLFSISFDLMKEVDNETIYKEEAVIEDSLKKNIISLLEENNDLLKENKQLTDLTVVLSKNNEILIDKFEKQSKHLSDLIKSSKNKSKRKYR